MTETHRIASMADVRAVERSIESLCLRHGLEDSARDAALHRLAELGLEILSGPGSGAVVVSIERGESFRLRLEISPRR